MTTLTEFLLARIAEDEATAQVSLERGFGGWEWLADAGINFEARTHIVRWHPARVLARCEADRRIVEEHAPVDYSPLGMKSPNACEKCGADLGMGDWEWMKDSYPCPTLRALASVYAAHPDYDGAWRP